MNSPTDNTYTIEEIKYLIDSRLKRSLVGGLRNVPDSYNDIEVFSDYLEISVENHIVETEVCLMR